jgi:hypothetical protein
MTGLETRLWRRLHHLFEEDDGSLPDIFVEGLHDSQLTDVYRFVRSHSRIYDDPGLWTLETKRDTPIRELDDPVKLLIDGKVDPFVHGLEDFEVDGTKLPLVIVFVWRDFMILNYRMGEEWGPRQLHALFRFLSTLKDMARQARVTHRDSGSNKRTEEFAEAFDEYYLNVWEPTAGEKSQVSEP